MPPQLSGADELLDIPLDEDCLQRLLSGDVADDTRAKVKVRCASTISHAMAVSHAYFDLWKPSASDVAHDLRDTVLTLGQI